MQPDLNNLPDPIVEQYNIQRLMDEPGWIENIKPMLDRLRSSGVQLMMETESPHLIFEGRGVTKTIDKINREIDLIIESGLQAQKEQQHARRQ